MTTYILNSGGIKHHPDKATTFYQEIIKGLPAHPNILYCFFAQKRENWEEKFASHTDNFHTLVGDLASPHFQLAMPDRFVQQGQACDAIIIHGGDDHLLQYWLRQYDLPKLWDGKVVAASSAGSDALVSAFWTCDWRQCMQGLGILPIKFIPHFRSASYAADDPRGPIDWNRAYEEMAAFGDPSLPIHALEEGEFITFNK